MKLYNSLSRKIEEFQPLNPPKVTMYTCGPTVYDRMHIGNLRTFLLSDLLFRLLQYNNYQVVAVQNITDIEDKIIKRAKETGKTIEEATSKYVDLFVNDVRKLNMSLSRGKQPRATEYIKDIIDYIKVLLEKGIAYEKDGSVYFDLSKFSDYGKLSRIDKTKLKTGVRISLDEYSKDDAQDFALWKATPQEDDRYIFNSPWGKGRPGWHIECSVMSIKNLGETIDIHIGGNDLIFPHHENEIAQSEAKTGKEFVRFFVHGEHILIDGQKMSKSLNNFYTLGDVMKKELDPLALRLLYLQTHYRKQMNFTWESVKAADLAYKNLKEQIITLKQQNERTTLSEEKQEKIDELRNKFNTAISDDLQIPQALAVLWETLKSNIPSQDKLDLLYVFDDVLGLNLKTVKQEELPENVIDLKNKINEARKDKNFELSDKYRKELEKLGYEVRDTPDGTVVKKT